MLLYFCYYTFFQEGVAEVFFFAAMQQQIIIKTFVPLKIALSTGTGNADLVQL